MSVEAYRDKALAKLAELQAEVDKARAKAKGASADLRLRAEKEVDELQKAVEAAKQRVAGLAEASEEKLSELEVRFGETMDDLRSQARGLLDRIKKIG